MRIRTQVVVALFVLGIAARLLLASTFTGMQADARYYDEISNSVAAGGGLEVWIPQYGVLRAAYPPLYPLLLGLWKVIGGQAVILNTAIDLGAAWLVYRIGKSELAAAAYFLFPSVVLSSLLPLKEGLAVMLVLASMRLVSRPMWFGAVAGLIALCQPAWAPLSIVAFALARRPVYWPTAFIACVAVMAPWWLRNWSLLGVFVPLTSSTGLSLYVAATGQWLPVHDPETSREALRLAWQIIVQDPGAYLFRIGKSLVRAFVFDDAAIQALHWTTARWLRPAFVISEVCWVALVAAALWFRRIDRLLAIYLIAGGVTVALDMWFEFGTRHRAFLVPLLILMVMSRSARARSAHP